MKKENAKLAAKRKREEMERIILLVERARRERPAAQAVWQAAGGREREKREAREREKREGRCRESGAGGAQREKDRIAWRKLVRQKKKKRKTLNERRRSGAPRSCSVRLMTNASDPMADLDFSKLWIT